MKTIRLITNCLIILFCVSFASCSSEEDEPKVNPDVKKRLVSIEYKGSNYSGSLSFDYSNDKVVKIVDRYSRTGNNSYNHNWSYTLSYNSNSITVIFQGYDTEGGNRTERTTIYNLNNNGYITNGEEEDGGIWNFAYSNNYLIVATLTYMGNKDENDKYVFNNQGVMTSHSGDEGEISYTDIPNIGGLFLAYNDSEYNHLLNACLLGKAPQYLPKKIVGYEQNGILNYTYEFDKEGYVTKTIITYEGYPHADWTETYTYEAID